MRRRAARAAMYHARTAERLEKLALPTDLAREPNAVHVFA
eukprot:COSAG06_NODE_44115_length_366_cov_0.580524_1_plen_39_part_01